MALKLLRDVAMDCYVIGQSYCYVIGQYCYENGQYCYVT